MIRLENRQKRFYEFEKERLSSEVIGKFILCEAREEKATRLFIHQFHSFASMLTKNGWWDTFTITKHECVKGFYLCTIDEVRNDKDGYLNFVVTPKKYLGSTTHEDSIAWDYLFWTGKFADEYTNRYLKFKRRFNVLNLERTFAKGFEESGFQKIANYIFREFLGDRLSLEDIATALEEKYDIEKLAENIHANIATYAENYPLFVKKIPHEQSYGRDRYRTADTVDFLKRKSQEYDTLRLGEENGLLERVEAVHRYRAECKEKKNQERRDKRKQKKE